MRNLAFIVVLSLAYTAPSLSTPIERSDSNFNMPFAEGNQFNADLAIDTEYVDNFLHNRVDEESTMSYALRSSVFSQAHNDEHLVQAMANLKAITFDNFSDDDHADISVFTKYFYKLQPDHRLFVSASFDQYYEYRGTGLTQGMANAVDKGDTKQNKLANIGYQFGRVDTVSRLNVFAGIQSSGYTTRESVTRLYEYDRRFVHLDIDYLLSGKTYLAFDANFSDLSYKDNELLEREDTNALFGIKWQATHSSELAILLGYQQVDFSHIDLSESKFAWRASYQWQPSEHLNVALQTARRSENETEQGSDLKITDLYQASLDYQFAERWLLAVQMSFQENDVVSRDFERTDEELTAIAKLSYQFSPRLNIYSHYQLTEKDSDFLPYSYDKQAMSIGVECKI